MLSRKLPLTGLFLIKRPVSCDFTSRFINNDVVRMRIDIWRIKPFAFVLLENWSVLFFVLSRVLQKLDRTRSPRAFVPRNQLQKLVCCFGVSLGRCSKHS